MAFWTAGMKTKTKTQYCEVKICLVMKLVGQSVCRPMMIQSHWNDTVSLDL